MLVHWCIACAHCSSGWHLWECTYIQLPHELKPLLGGLDCCTVTLCTASWQQLDAGSTSDCSVLSPLPLDVTVQDAVQVSTGGPDPLPA